MKSVYVGAAAFALTAAVNFRRRWHKRQKRSSGNTTGL